MTQRQITAIIATLTIAVIAVLLVFLVWWTVNQEALNKNTASNVNNSNMASNIDLESFKAMALSARCVDERNSLAVIDNKMVFWQRSGNCLDASYNYTLYGKDTTKILCTRHDSIAGPQMNCNDTSYQSIFQTILDNLDKNGLGLEPLHKIEPINLK